MRSINWIGDSGLDMSSSADQYGGSGLPDRCISATLCCVDATMDGLRTLSAVVRSGSMAAAASELGVDKATVSRRLAGLEQTRPGLFERRAGKLELSPAASRALEALGSVEQAMQRVKEALSGPSDAR